MEKTTDARCLTRDEKIDRIVRAGLEGLKNFQLDTVKHVAELFEQNRNRVLVADEVGLGKTMVARGVISKMAELRFCQEGDDFFRVVYICSNQSIANQNVAKLNILDAKKENVSDTRLSMQHLRITEQYKEAQEAGQITQLIPLTPETSFRMTSGAGSAQERALMYAILGRLPEFEGDVSEKLGRFLICGAEKSWEKEQKNYKDRVDEIAQGDNPTGYPNNVLQAIREYCRQQVVEGKPDLIAELAFRLKNWETPITGDSAIILGLRKMFAHISIKMLDADFVIMDEFQRFRFLINAKNEDSEAGYLAKEFLNDRKTRVLLLSATPYKMYSTPEEIETDPHSDHYREFHDVMEFLLNDAADFRNFKTVWKDYSKSLQTARRGNWDVLYAKKEAAQQAMYQGICRTERISVMSGGDYMDDSSVKTPMAISEYDIRSYVEMAKLLRDSTGETLPVDYAKSCPYLMSFMKKYKVREHIQKYFSNHQEDIDDKFSGKPNLWVEKDKIAEYQKLSISNARLQTLQQHIFANKEHLYMWVPPSRPYYAYEEGTVYHGSQHFSKILVFSSWEMVPKMIGSLISYEAERLTIGELAQKERHISKTNKGYFTEENKRFLVPRLLFRTTNGRRAGMSLFCLIYPSKTLAKLYNPIDCMNHGLTLRQIRENLAARLQPTLRELANRYLSPEETREDERWYHLAPFLMDQEYGQFWIAKILNSEKDYDSELDGYQDDDDSKKVGKGKQFHLHLEYLKDLLAHPRLGTQPKDLIEVLVDMAIGSPAVCAYRSNGADPRRATELARGFLNRFNQQEAIAIVELSYPGSEDDYHWKNVLRYCVDGNLQAMMDEYTHIAVENTGSCENAHTTMLDALKFRTASYDAESFEEFKASVLGTTNGEDGIKRKLRSRFAAAFSKGEGSEEAGARRKDSVRNAFNSPFRPFILASTSIGQEGLDFHSYCRKIMHWNLPSNPIDLEQREGRINRYKCLAIRQNIAEEYGRTAFEADVWKEMFRTAEADKAPGESDLVPYWCLGKDQKIKIERLVPMYPISKDRLHYERLIQILSLYRLSMGQPRQEELLDYMFREFKGDTEKLQELFINLSPLNRQS